MSDKKHKMNCNSCKQEFDMRDLVQVFAHEECNGIPVNYLKLKKTNILAVKIGEPVLYMPNGDQLNLN